MKTVNNHIRRAMQHLLGQFVACSCTLVIGVVTSLLPARAFAQVYVADQPTGSVISGYANPSTYTTTPDQRGVIVGRPGYRDVYGGSASIRGRQIGSRNISDIGSATAMSATHRSTAQSATASAVIHDSARLTVPYWVLALNRPLNLSVGAGMISHNQHVPAAQPEDEINRQTIIAPAPLTATGTTRPVDPAFVPLSVHHDIYGPGSVSSRSMQRRQRADSEADSQFRINEYYSRQRWNTDAWYSSYYRNGYNGCYPAFGYGYVGTWCGWPGWYGCRGFLTGAPVIVYPGFGSIRGGWSGASSCWPIFDGHTLNSCGGGLSIHIQF